MITVSLMISFKIGRCSTFEIVRDGHMRVTEERGEKCLFRFVYFARRVYVVVIEPSELGNGMVRQLDKFGLNSLPLFLLQGCQF